MSGNTFFPNPEEEKHRLGVATYMGIPVYMGVLNSQVVFMLNHQYPAAGLRIKPLTGDLMSQVPTGEKAESSVQRPGLFLVADPNEESLPKSPQ